MSKTAMTHEEFVTRMAQISPDITLLGKYINSKSRIPYVVANVVSCGRPEARTCSRGDRASDARRLLATRLECSKETSSFSKGSKRKIPPLRLWRNTRDLIKKYGLSARYASTYGKHRHTTLFTVTVAPNVILPEKAWLKG
ncbi:MAG: hypothetical protein V8R44_04665 [Eggerthellaceae bacterium]